MTGRRHPNTSDLFEIVRGIAEKRLDNVPEITPETRFDDLNFDSLDKVDFLAYVWQDLGVWIQDSAAQTFKTVRNAMDYIKDPEEYLGSRKIKPERIPAYAMGRDE